MSSEIPGGTHPRADVLAEEYRGRYLWNELDKAKARIADLEEQIEALEADHHREHQAVEGWSLKCERLGEQVQALEREADNLTERLEKRIDEDSVYRVYDEQVEENQRLKEQYQTALDRLWEAHDQLCGCDRPTDAGRCSAPQETWGAFEYLGERPAPNPASGSDK